MIVKLQRCFKGIFRSVEEREPVRLRLMWMQMAVEAAFLLYSYLALGNGFLFLQFAVILVPMSVLIGLLLYFIKGDYILAMLAFLLLNVGFMIQMVSQNNTGEILIRNMCKCLFVFIAAFLIGIFFYRFSYFLSYDAMILVLLAVQGILEILLLIIGTVTGDLKGQGALISFEIGGIEILPLEVVKVIYIFIIAALLCKDECKDKKILGIPRELVAAVYSILTLGSICLFKELGTVLVLLLTGGAMMAIYCRNRKFFRRLILLGDIAAFLSVGGCILFRKKISLLNKVYLRFQYWLNPEMDANGLGYQGLRMREGLAIGGLFGPETRRYVIGIPQEKDDMIFAKIVECCGAFMGFLIILIIMLLIRQSMFISQRAKDTYYSGLAMAITILFAVESMIHIGYNTGMLPITGISLYLVSRGFTSVTLGTCMLTVLLIISTNTQERSRYDEAEFNEKVQRICRKVFRIHRRKT